MTKQVKRLSSLEIDEISTVDRPANQHGLVAFTKRAEDEDMTQLYDSNGQPVDTDDLNVGDWVYDEDGTEIRILTEEMADALEDANIDISETPDDLSELFEPELVGKAFSMGAAITGGKSSLKAVGTKGKEALGIAEGGLRSGAAKISGMSTGRKLGAAAGGAGAVGFGSGRLSKSLGDQVFEELSKAASEGDRDAVISKAMDQVSKAQRQAQVAIAKAEALQEQHELGQYVELAKSYALPVDDTELGQILQTVSKVLDADQLEFLERVFLTAGEAVSKSMDELGWSGEGQSNVLGDLSAAAAEVVAKSDLTEAQAMTELLSANPAAYDEYLRDQSNG